jgi:hypothetical protein
MKIDLYNNHEQYIAELRQDRTVEQFCRGLGISKTKLESHPCIADVATVLAFDQHQVWMTERDQQIWRHAWAWVYHRELPLNTYHKQKLNSILNSIEYRQRMKKAITMTSKKGRPSSSLTDRLEQRR